ncbi:MAG: cupin domain-containing protein [Candidatus Thermoplasmatota archaeon]|nr:cupin domain-containing protein [Candidatus Thermoplasmatota archaeon]
MTVQGYARKFDEIEEKDLQGGGKIRWLITHKDGAPNFSMRLITVKAWGSTPAHSHEYEHEIYVIEGKGTATIGAKKFEVSKDSFLFIPGNEYHTINATTDMKMICVVPISAAKEILGE